ncbi:MAG: hypothetical protein ICV78_03720 [Tolypothrix sp. Co-bin9]|nr:hypothetical protein [Tolypothrix sp. Co-bin9]
MLRKLFSLVALVALAPELVTMLPAVAKEEILFPVSGQNLQPTVKLPLINPESSLGLMQALRISFEWFEPTPNARGSQVAVGNVNDVWYIGNENRIYRFTGSGRVEPAPNARAISISVGSNISVWHVGINSRLYRLGG